MEVGEAVCVRGGRGGRFEQCQHGNRKPGINSNKRRKRRRCEET